MPRASWVILVPGWYPSLPALAKSNFRFQTRYLNSTDFHGGVIGTIADTAGGYAAFTLMDDDDGILTVEYKINMMAPASGELLIGRGQVLRPGRTFTVSQAEVSVVKNGKETVAAAMQQTLMRIVGRADVFG